MSNRLTAILILGLLSTILASASAQMKVGPAGQQGGLTLTSPLEYQVVQRQSPRLGPVHIHGVAGDGAGLIRFQFVDIRNGRSATGRWRMLKPAIATGVFDGVVKVPAGGWYRLEVTALKTRVVLHQIIVEHVGVGEVFVVAGQSNSTNYGAEKQVPATGMVSAFDGFTWRSAADPQPGVQDGSGGGSFIPAFGDALYLRYKVPIGVLSAGHGATSVRQWLPKGDPYEVPPSLPAFSVQVGLHKYESTGTLFDGLMTRLLPLGKNGFRLLLWHQGESDAHQSEGHTLPGVEYRAMLTRIIRASREATGWPFPWMVAQASYHLPSDPSDPDIRGAQKRLWDSGIALQGPDTDLLTDAYRAGVHFNGKGQRAHGLAWAEKVENYLDRVLK